MPRRARSAGHATSFEYETDARRESADGLTIIGMDRITVKFTTAMENNDGSPLSADAFSITVTAGTPHRSPASPPRTAKR